MELSALNSRTAVFTQRACESFKFNGGPPHDVALALADAVRHRAWVETHATKTHKLGAMKATLKAKTKT